MSVKKKKKTVSFTGDDAQKVFDILLSQLDIAPKKRTCIRKKEQSQQNPLRTTITLDERKFIKG